MRLPSGENAKVRPVGALAVKVLSFLPVAVSQMVILPSAVQEAARLVSGETVAATVGDGPIDSPVSGSILGEANSITVLSAPAFRSQTLTPSCGEAPAIVLPSAETTRWPRWRSKE